MFHKPIRGHELTQSPLIDEAFKVLEGIEQVIEIGTWKGGMALFLSKTFKVPVHTFDIQDYGYKFTKGITFHQCNVFEKQQTIIDLLKDKKTLLLCDGGNKVNEFTLFGRFLKKGDLIGAHDYGKTKEYFKNEIEGKFWTTSHEIEWANVERFCLENNLVRVHEDIFDKVVWLICEKQ